MAPITFLHAADLHLDSPFQNTKGLNEEWKNRLKESTWKALDNLIELALEKHVDFVILSGDIFDKESYSVKAKVRFYKMLTRLATEKIHTYIIHGNHDPYDDDSNSDFINSTQGFYTHIFPSNCVDSYSHYRDGVEIARLYGRSYWQRHVLENLAGQYIAKVQMDRSEKNIANDVLKIAVLHGQVGTAKESVVYAPFSIEEIKASSIHYWAMGHIHKKIVLHDQVPYIVYPGNVQGRHIAELGDRGCYVVNWADDQQAEILFHSLAAVRFEEIIFDIEGNQPTVVELIDLIRTHIQQYIDKRNQPHIVKLILTGQTAIYSEMRRQGVLEMVMEELQSEDLFVIDCINQTLPIVDMEQLRMQETLLGEFLTWIDKVKTDPEALAELAEELAELYEHPKYQQVTQTKPVQLAKEQWRIRKRERDWLTWLNEVERVGLDLFFHEE